MYFRLTYKTKDFYLIYIYTIFLQLKLTYRTIIFVIFLCIYAIYFKLTYAHCTDDFNQNVRAITIRKHWFCQVLSKNHCCKEK